MADPLQLSLGRPGKPQSLVRLRSGERLDTVRGARLSWDELARRLAMARVVFVGERHSNPDHHRVQAAVIDRLATGGALHIGMEMFYRGHAPEVFKRWAAGELDETQFRKAVRWRSQWGMDYGVYRPVFGAAKRHRLPIVGLNVPLKIARVVGRRGLAAVTPDLRKTLPRLHLGFARHRQVFRALLGLPPRTPRRPRPRTRRHPGHGHGRHHGLMERLYTAQVLRDEVMAAQIVRTLDLAGPRSRMVVIVGNGHLFYHTGVNHRLRRLRPGWPQATVICVSTGPKGRRVSRGLGDYLVATAHQPPQQPPQQPPRQPPRRRPTPKADLD